MVSKLAAAVTATGAVVSTSGLVVGSAQASSPQPTTTSTVASTTTTTVAGPASTTTTTTEAAPTTASTVATPPPTVARAHTPRPTGTSQAAKAASTANPNAYYGNPKMGVEIATATPGLYPVFGATNEPNLDGFSVVATPASGQPTLVGVTEPQPACAPGTALSTNSAPNLYCETDTDNGFEFPMAASPVTFDFTMGTTPAGYAHDPDQTLPLAVSEPACLGAPKGVDVCELESGPPPTSSDITWFDYIGIYRELTVTVKTSSGTLLPDVHVALACTAPGSDPSYACPPAGEKNNLDSTPIQPADASSSVRASTVGSTSNATTVTGPNGKGSFAGVYLPGSTVSLSVTPPAGYQAASLVSTVPSPVTAATTTGAALSRAAQTPVNLIVVLSKTPPATTTTTVPPTTTTSTTRPAAPTASTLPFTGANARGEAMDAGIAAAAGAGLLLIGRRRKRRGAHFTNSR